MGRARSKCTTSTPFSNSQATFLQVPNLELGHIEMDGEVAEKLASAAAREREDLGWKKWAGRVNQYLGKLERLLSPDLIVSFYLFWTSLLVLLYSNQSGFNLPIL